MNNTELKNLINALNTGILTNVKTYIDNNDNINSANISIINTSIGNIVSRLDLIDKIDSTDGIETISEKISALEQLLTNGPDLDAILTSIASINISVTDLANIVGILEDKTSVLETKVTSLESTTAANTSSIVTANAAIALNASKIADAEAAGLQALETVTSNSNRVGVLENELNDTNDVNGAVNKGIKSKVTDLEVEVGDVKTNLTNNYITRQDIADLQANFLCEMVNVSAEIFGLPQADCTGSNVYDANAL